MSKTKKPKSDQIRTETRTRKSAQKHKVLKRVQFPFPIMVPGPGGGRATNTFSERADGKWPGFKASETKTHVLLEHKDSGWSTTVPLALAVRHHRMEYITETYEVEVHLDDEGEPFREIDDKGNVTELQAEAA